MEQPISISEKWQSEDEILAAFTGQDFAIAALGEPANVHLIMVAETS